MVIKFRPWIGDRYSEGINGIKVLVLGESHWCADEKDAVPEITVNVIKDLLDPDSEQEGYKNTYTKFAKALSGKFGTLSDEDKIELWHSIAFYNYVQFPIAGPRRDPTSQEFKDSEEAFFEVLELLQPDIVIAWGKRLYNNLPQAGRQGEDIIAPDGKIIETWTYTLTNGKKIRVIPIMHPSAAFSPEYWNAIINKTIHMKNTFG